MKSALDRGSTFPVTRAISSVLQSASSTDGIETLSTIRLTPSSYGSTIETEDSSRIASSCRFDITRGKAHLACAWCRRRREHRCWSPRLGQCHRHLDAQGLAEQVGQCIGTQYGRAPGLKTCVCRRDRRRAGTEAVGAKCQHFDQTLAVLDGDFIGMVGRERCIGRNRRRSPYCSTTVEPATASPDSVKTVSCSSPNGSLKSTRM